MPDIAPEYTNYLLLSTGCALLIWLSYIDLKIRILPNKLVFAFAIVGFCFHLITGFTFATPSDMAFGAIIVFVLLYMLRILANKIYQQDAFGMGDVKLMTAGGLWLGQENIMLALTIGATLCILHGVIVSIATKTPLATLKLPAGPGLALGLFLIGFWMLYLNPGQIQL